MIFPVRIRLKPAVFILLLQVLVTDPSKLQAIRDREEDIMKERIDLILKAVSGVAPDHCSESDFPDVRILVLNSAGRKRDSDDQGDR